MGKFLRTRLNAVFSFWSPLPNNFYKARLGREKSGASFVVFFCRVEQCNRYILTGCKFKTIRLFKVKSHRVFGDLFFLMSLTMKLTMSTVYHFFEFFLSFSLRFCFLRRTFFGVTSKYSSSAIISSPLSSVTLSGGSQNLFFVRLSAHTHVGKLFAFNRVYRQFVAFHCVADDHSFIYFCVWLNIQHASLLQVV